MSFLLIAALVYVYLIYVFTITWLWTVAGSPYGFFSRLLRTLLLPIVFPFMALGNLLNTAFR